MLPDRVSNPGPLTYESGALPIALHGLAPLDYKETFQKWIQSAELQAKELQKTAKNTLQSFADNPTAVKENLEKNLQYSDNSSLYYRTGKLKRIRTEVKDQQYMEKIDTAMEEIQGHKKDFQKWIQRASSEVENLGNSSNESNGL